MSKDRFTIISTSAFERAARKLAGKVPHMDEWLSEAGLIPESDPFNLSKQHQIKKLHGVDTGEPLLIAATSTDLSGRLDGCHTRLPDC